MVQEGKRPYAAAGLCFACHGPEAKGVQGMGADLTDSNWAHSDGSFDGILRTITQGVTAEKSTNGVVMPPKGGSQLTDAQVRAVGAYIWSLSRPKGK
jgi:mono/diheme cytochrome c family protein